MTQDTFTLNNGLKIPKVGFGGAAGSTLDETVEVFLEAFKAGYRHIDTAYLYGSEEAVGVAVKKSGIPREEFYITTKLWNVHHKCVNYGFEKSLKALDMDYVDLYIMHWPQSMEGDIDAPGPSFKEEYASPMYESPTFVETYKDMEKLVKDGRAKSIGVSNFSIHNMEILLKETTIVPVTNQVEGNIYLPQKSLSEYCRSKNILMTAWSPLSRPSPTAKPSILTEPVVLKLAEKYKNTPAVIGLSWLVQRGWAVIPLSRNPERMRDNLKIIPLDEKDMSALTQIHTEPGKLGRGREFRQGRPYVNGDKCMGSTMEELGFLPDD